MTEKELEQNIAASFYFGMAFGFASRYDEKDKILKDIREIIDEKELCADTISRKAAIESIKNLYPDMPIMDIMGARQKWRKKYAPYIECENVIEQLSPVNPIKTVTNAKEAEEYQICDNCKHNTDSWDSDACDGCCGNHSRFEPQEISREEIAALLARESEERKRKEVLQKIRQKIDGLRYDHWIGNVSNYAVIDTALEIIDAHIEVVVESEENE